MMGFFSSRRPDSEAYIEEEKPVVNVIRSRFYGKNKGKGRDAAERPNSQMSLNAPSASKPNRLQDHSSTPRTSSRMEHTPPFSSSLRPRPPNTTGANTHTPSPRASTDAITVMLAQRLNELATANAEGLLDDDEYRLLRQSLFERLANNSAIPSEAPVVPIAGPSHTQIEAPGRASSTYRSNSSRPPSIQSKRSVTSTVSGIFRRATGRRSTSTSRDHSDTTSVFSIGSVSSNIVQRRFFSRTLSKQSSELSLRTDGPAPFDVLSLSSQHAKSVRGGISTEPATPNSPNLSRVNTRSTRRLAQAPPPSSFNGRAAGLEFRNTPTGGTDLLGDDERLQTAKDIQKEIESVEAEGRRLLDAFNGLELSTLTRRQQRPGHLTANASSSHLAVPGMHPAEMRDPLDSTRTLVPDRKSRLWKDSDGVSVRSSGSNGTSLSDYRSPTRARPKGGSPLVAQPISLARKSSFASISSRGRSGSTSTTNLQPSSSTLGRLGGASSSSVNLARSATHLPLATVAEGDGRESMDGHRPRVGSSLSAHVKTASGGQRVPSHADADDGEIAALELEMADIRRRRAEVVGRYEERLEYLRAKLKSAELHEKLLRQ
ncbi:hypothetical protein EW146_g837 [Bondarzewia mesenterica]|uniref:Uncharacterized protein n=1 Tax=Bondarzewia mesenterica TaxID=1095465 RepID=A0A4V3XG98_9AGAM|nr:hypothetical protein EW146_g837 [Bondarzewia mesenterica]